MLCHCGVCCGGLSQVVQTSSGKRVKTQPLVADINFGMAASAATQTASDLSRYCKYRVGRRLVSLQALRHELVSLLPGGWRHIQLSPAGSPACRQRRCGRTAFSYSPMGFTANAAVSLMSRGLSAHTRVRRR